MHGESCHYEEKGATGPVLLRIYAPEGGTKLAEVMRFLAYAIQVSESAPTVNAEICRRGIQRADGILTRNLAVAFSVVQLQKCAHLKLNKTGTYLGSWVE